MREDFLHYIWRYGVFNQIEALTVKGEPLFFKNLGQLNLDAGPDFFGAQIQIGDQLWAGNVEIHVKSSDWYVHNHQKDAAYNNVILHVVWQHDTEIFRKDNSIISTLELKNYVNKNLQQTYQKLMLSKSWINCESYFSEVDEFLLKNWLERLYIERLEDKSKLIESLLVDSKNDWEAVLFKMLAKSFGLKINSDAFLSIANSVDYAVIRKLQNQPLGLETLFLGQSGVLEMSSNNDYFNRLKSNYSLLKQKFILDNSGVIPLKFFRLRPSNFPTIRLSQLAMLYEAHHNLFSKIIGFNTHKDFYQLFSIESSEFWKSHYTFNRQSKPIRKQLTNSFIELLIINAIIPIKFSYAQSQGLNIDDEVMALVKGLKAETNSVVLKFLGLKPIEKTALNSQALIHLKQNYCDKNKCLNCSVGNSLILKN